MPDAKWPKIASRIRRATLIFLAALVWFHALLFLNVPTPLPARFIAVIHLQTTEIFLLGLLAVLSFLSISGFWTLLKSVAYIYFFPFVALWGCFRCLFFSARAINRWLIAHSPHQPAKALSISPQKDAAIPPESKKLEENVDRASVLAIAIRPFQRFMLLWGILLVITTHKVIVWICLVIVLIQLARKLFLVMKLFLFSEPWISKYGKNLCAGYNQAINTLLSLKLDTESPDQKTTWDQLVFWRKIFSFLRDPYLVSRWAWILGACIFGSLYLYVALLFSFSYYGLARVCNYSYSWPESFLTSVFIPFYASNLPNIFSIRLLGGIQGLVVIGLGVGTVVKFFQRKAEMVRTAAADLLDRLSDPAINERYLILEGKFSAVDKNG